MSAPQERLGYTLPFEGLSLPDHAEVMRQAEQIGYTDAWTGEVDATDGFTPLAVAAMATETTRLGTGVVSAYTRGPGTLAMTAASLAELAPGRTCLGIGASSNVIVERWNSIPFDRPLSRVRDTAEVVRAALAGEKVRAELDTMTVKGLRLARPPEQPVPIFIAALRSGMLRLAGRVGDGVLLNWLGAGDIPKVVAEVRKGEAEAGGRAPAVEIACRVFVCPGDSEAADRAARRYIAAYMTVPVYAKFQEWLGRGEALRAMNEAWADGRRQEATEVIPDEVVRDLIIFGDAESCRQQIAAYRAAGVDTVVLHWLPSADEPEARTQQILDSLVELAPAAHAAR
jgi:probable F420-dependent oxidoreductase